MGYPIEVPNKMPGKPPVPLRDPFTRLVTRLADLFRRQRRKARRSDRPEAYGQGVKPTWPAVRPGDSRELDFDELHGRLEERA